MQWMIALGSGLIGAVIGGGGVLGYLNSRDQLDLDKTKHKDALGEPKRLHRLTELQKAATAVSDAIAVIQATAAAQPVTWKAISGARGRVAAVLPVVESLAPQAAISYRSAQTVVNDDRRLATDRDMVIQVMQGVVADVHAAIVDL